MVVLVRRRKITAILLATSLVAVLLVSLLLMDTTVSGKVLDEDGNPLPGVTIRDSGSLLTASSITDQEGEFSITIKGYGPHTLRSEKEGYWIHKRTCDINQLGASIDGFDFQLTRNQEIWVTYASVFYTRADNQTTPIVGEIGVVSLPPSRDIVIKDLSVSGKDFSYTLKGGGSDVTNAQSLLKQLLVEVSGEYWDTPGDADNCYAIEVLSWRSWGFESDYLNESEVEGEVCNLLPGESMHIISNMSMETVVPEQLSPKVSVAILGEVFTHTLTVELQLPSEGAVVLSCDIENYDDVEHEFKIFEDETGVLHIWQIE